MPRGKRRTKKEIAELLSAYKKAVNKVEWLKKQHISSATIYRYRKAAKK